MRSGGGAAAETAEPSEERARGRRARAGRQDARAGARALSSTTPTSTAPADKIRAGARRTPATAVPSEARGRRARAYRSFSRKQVRRRRKPSLTCLRLKQGSPSARPRPLFDRASRQNTRSHRPKHLPETPRTLTQQSGTKREARPRG